MAPVRAQVKLPQHWTASTLRENVDSCMHFAWSDMPTMSGTAADNCKRSTITEPHRLQLVQALLNAQRPPSQGGPAIPAPPSPLLHVLAHEQQVPATPASQTFPVFGQQSQSTGQLPSLGCFAANSSAMHVQMLLSKDRLPPHLDTSCQPLLV